MALIICPECHRKFSTHAASCPRCGFPLIAIAELENIQVTEHVNYRQRKNNKKTALTISLISVSAIMLLIVSYVVLFYSQAVVAKNNQDFTKAKECYDKLLIADRAFADDYAYVTAGVLMEAGNYIAALDEFEALDDYDVPESIIRTLKAEIYAIGQSHYSQKNYAQALCYFDKVGEYRRVADYKLLLEYHTEVSKTFSTSEKQQLFSLIGFEDGSDVILGSSDTALSFLAGTWKNGTANFQFTKSGDVQTNLPISGVSDHFSIYGGKLLSFPDGSMSYQVYQKHKNNPHFSFEIINLDTIDVYCFDDGATYTLFRQ